VTTQGRMSSPEDATNLEPRAESIAEIHSSKIRTSAAPDTGPWTTASCLTVGAIIYKSGYNEFRFQGLDFKFNRKVGANFGNDRSC
jgi:hypothetical protein